MLLNLQVVTTTDAQMDQLLLLYTTGRLCIFHCNALTISLLQFAIMCLLINGLGFLVVWSS
jgi:hypothetical protein